VNLSRKGYARRTVVSTWDLKHFDITEENQENLCRDGRSQELPDAD